MRYLSLRPAFDLEVPYFYVYQSYSNGMYTYMMANKLLWQQSY